MAGRFGKLYKIMSKHEANCFDIARKWQRSTLLRKFRQRLFPNPPYYAEFKQAPIKARLMYFSVILLISPLLISIALLQLLWFCITFPFRYIVTYTIPLDIQAPGEANIQGIHHAFNKYLDLPADLYMACVDEWVKELYGPEVLHTHNMSRYMQTNQYEQLQAISYEGDSIQSHMRSSINIARERLSQALGSYRST